MKKRKIFMIPLIGLSLFGITSCNDEDTVTSTPVVSSQVLPTTSSGPQEVTLSRINANVSNLKKSYYEGENLDLSGLVVTATYTDGTSKQVTDYTYDESSFNKDEKGYQYLKIIYTDEGVTKTTNVLIEVKSILDETIHVIGITANTNNTTYTYQQDLDLSDLVVTAYYTDGTDKVLENNEYTIDSSAFNNEKRGDYEIGIKYKETYTNEVASKDAVVETCVFTTVKLNMESISFKSGTYSVDQYDCIDISDWKIEIQFKEGTTETITSGFSTNLSSLVKDTNTAINETITISYTYNGKTCTTTTIFKVNGVRKSFNAGSLDVSNNKVTESTELENFTLTPGYTVIASNESCDNQSFIKSLVLEGAGTRDEYSIKFDSSKKDSYVTVVASTAEECTLGLYDSEGTVIKTVELGSNLVRYTFKLNGASTYYIWSSGGAQIYYVGTYYGG